MIRKWSLCFLIRVFIERRYHRSLYWPKPSKSYFFLLWWFCCLPYPQPFSKVVSNVVFHHFLDWSIRDSNMLSRGGFFLIIFTIFIFHNNDFFGFIHPLPISSLFLISHHKVVNVHAFDPFFCNPSAIPSSPFLTGFKIGLYDASYFNFLFRVLFSLPYILRVWNDCYLNFFHFSFVTYIGITINVALC